MEPAEDFDTLARARAEGRVVVSADSDFAALLAVQDASQPSLVLFRENDAVTAEQYAALSIANLPAQESDLASSCVAVFRGGRVRVRSLPISAT